jgi:hypothetical protein
MMSAMSSRLKKCDQFSHAGRPTGAQSGSAYSPGNRSTKPAIGAHPMRPRAIATTMVARPTTARATSTDAASHCRRVVGRKDGGAAVTGGISRADLVT